MKENHATLMKGIKYRNYSIQDELGRGSFGVVYKAQRDDGEIVAIKSILLSRYKEHGGLVGQLVENEKKALMKLKSLHVIKLIEYFEEDNQGLFILEYCDSGNLEDLWMKRNCRFPLGIALNYFKQILKGMKALHEEKIVHRDLKMANILVHGDVLKIADFGFCHMFKNYTSLTQLNLGTPGHKAPEVVEGKPYGLSSDMFAVGVILYQMIFEINPFNSCNDKVFLQEVKNSNPPKFKLQDGLPVDPNIIQLLTQMLKYDPQQRLKWTELFNNRIFMGQSSLMMMKDKTEYLADIDPYASRLFYEKAEKANYFDQDQVIEDNSKKNTIQDSMPILLQEKPVAQPLNTQQLMIQHKEEYQEEKSLEEISNKIINDYTKQKFPITWVSITYNQMRTINHKQIFRSIFVSYMLMKQIYYQHLKLRQSIKSNPQYNALMKNDVFKTFMREFEEENELLHIHLTIEFQTVQANSEKLHKYIQTTWKQEIYQLNQTSQFQQIFKESVQLYIQYIHNEFQSSLSQDILIYILRLLNCRDYEKLCKKEDISEEFRKIQERSAATPPLNIQFVNKQNRLQYILVMSFIDEHLQPMEIEAEQNEVRPQEVHQQNRFLHQKRLIIVDEKCQAIVPDKPERVHDTFTKHKPSLLFQTDKISNMPNIDDYLLFAQSLVLNQVDEVSLEDTKKKNKGFSGDGLILSGLTITQEQVNERALMFLKSMDYSILKAKFYLLFPTLLVYNQFKHRHSLNFTDEYMNEKIEQYISKLNEDKMMQQNKWKQDLTELINSKQKVHLNQLQQLLDLGQSLKYEVPEQIKHIYQQSMQIQRQLNKLPKEKQTLDKLRQSLEKYEEQIPVITTEIQQLREQVQKSEIFYSKLQKLPIPLDENQNFESVFEKLITNPTGEKIQLRILANYNQEYKQLPIEIKAFELLHKRLYEFILDISEKINKFTKIQQTKTRLGQQISNQGEKTEKMTLQQAGLFASQINNVIVSCDDFENFNELYLQALDLNEKAKMQIDDTDVQQRLLGEVLDCPFYLDVQERLQSMIDYSQILESIKQKMTERQHLCANQQIIQLLNRGIINEELKYLQSQTQKVLEWNQLADEILEYHQNVTLVDVYNENFELQQYPNTLTSPPQDIINQLEPTKLQEMSQIAERIKEWKDQLISLIDCKQFQQQANLRKTNQNKSFNKLWELFKEGLRYKTELSLMNKVRQIILSILDWYAQVYIIKQTLRLNDDISTQIDGIDMICKMFIQKNGTLTTLEQVEKLQKFQSPFVNGTKDLQVIQALTIHTDKWNKEAKEALQSQNQEWIRTLLEESSKLPVDESLVQELQLSHASSLKVNWILSTITSKETLFESILNALENDESIKQLKEDMQNIYSQSPLNKKKKEGVKLSKLAQQFYLNHQNTINSYLAQLNSIDETKLKKIQSVKIQKLKDYQKEVQNDDVYRQIEEWTQQFINWQQQISSLNDQQQSKKKKKQKDSESQSDAYTLTGELLYYFKVPEMLCLVLLGISKNYLSQELISSIEKLVQIYNETQIALQVQSVKEVTHYSEVFMPQFYVMAKKFRVINNWIQMAQDMINDIPRLKNIIMIQKLKPFLDYLNQLQPQEFNVEKPQPLPQPPLQTVQSQGNVKKKIQKSLHKFKVKSQEESQPTQDQESQSVKHSKRVKQVSKLMQDESIAFYDANVPLGKAFRQSPHEIMPSDPVMQALKKPIKRSYKRVLNRKLPPQVEIEPGSANFLEYLRSSSQELLNLYSSENIYCTCRQGGESAITDFQIIKSLEEKNVEQFYYHHAKLQQQVKFMICCDSCDQWYHYECMGIKKQKEQQDRYNCRSIYFYYLVCLQKNNVPFLILNETLWEKYLNGTELYEEYAKQKAQFEKNVLPNSGEYIYSGFELPTFSDFKEFVKIGRSLPAQLVELELLELLQLRVEEWINKYDNNKTLTLTELIALYAESEWLPIALPQSKLLLQLISQKEFLNTANELLQSKATFKSKQLKKTQLEKTEQLYFVIKESNPELLQEIDNQIIKTIHMLRVQSEMNNHLQSQIKQSLTIEQYEQLINQFEREVKQQIQQSDIKFTLPKLNELKIQHTKIQHWDAEIRDMFVDITDIYTQNLSQQYYDSKPNLSDIQVKLKEYELFTIKSPNICYDFVKALQAKAEEIILLIDSNVQQQSLDDQFELCRSVYKLKCKIPQFKDLLNNVHKEVQLRLIQWLPFIKAGLC